ncbi:PD-(D/E)XK nuclease family protein, partial [Streptomyces tendae]
HAVLIVKPDLLYLEHGSWVWRETKTTQSADAWMGRDPFTTDPQLALAVVLLAVGAFGGDPAGSRVELEVLRPDSGDPSYIEPCNEPERVEAARRLVREYVDAWRGDEVFTPRPGAHCRTCPVTEWCASAPEEVRRGRR